MTEALTTEARGLLVTAFTGSAYRIYDTVPNVPTPPAVVIVPDSPWIVPGRIGNTLNYEARWRIMVVIKKRQNAAETLDTENAIDEILSLIPSTFQVTAVNAPQLNDIGAQGVVVTTEINVSIQMKEG